MTRNNRPPFDKPPSRTRSARITETTWALLALVIIGWLLYLILSH